jgi:hypothetical protein
MRGLTPKFVLATVHNVHHIGDPGLVHHGEALRVLFRSLRRPLRRLCEILGCEILKLHFAIEGAEVRRREHRELAADLPDHDATPPGLPLVAEDSGIRRRVRAEDRRVGRPAPLVHVRRGGRGPRHRETGRILDAAEVSEGERQ